MSEVRFDKWTTTDLAGQCRMQAREFLDPEHSAFMLAVSARLTALAEAEARVRRAALEEAAKIAEDWLRLYGDRPIQHVSATRYATDAVTDIADGIRALANTTPETRQPEMAWRDISTAPTDGFPFLAVVDGDVRVVAHGKASHVPLFGWVLVDQGAEDAELCEPTCWQPLPVPPEPPARIANLDREDGR